MRSLLNSIRFKLILGLIVIVLPILCFLIYNNLYSIQLVRSQVAQSNSNLLQLHMGLIDKDLESIDSYLFHFAIHNTGLSRLERPSSQNEDLYHMVKYQLFRELYERVSAYDILDYFFIYSTVNRDPILAHNSAYLNSGNTLGVTDGIAELVENNERMQTYAYESWSSLRMNGGTYLIRILKTGNLYVGALVNYDRAMRSLDMLDLGTDGKALLIDADKTPLQYADFLSDNGIAPHYSPDRYQLTGGAEKFLVVGEHSQKGDFSLLAVIPDRTVIENLPYTQRIIMFIALGVVVILLGALMMMRRIIIKPITKIIEAMRKVRDGHLDARIAPAQTSNEFQVMNDTFNSMASQIQELKIDIYEEQLLSQKAEMKQLQMQINPHFYLNSLNAFYHLSEDNNTKVIKELSLSLIKYFRFMFRSNGLDVVTLEDEINHVKNYLTIQQFRFEGNLTSHIAAPEQLLQCNVPLFVLQTFVENAVKHAVTLDQPTHIEIEVQLDETAADKRMLLRIRDNGQGFPEPILRQFAAGQTLLNEKGEHVGIWNMKRRLWLLYKEQADISFRNDCGAVVDIALPLQQ